MGNKVVSYKLQPATLGIQTCIKFKPSLYYKILLEWLRAHFALTC